jgi:hypothetical protein
VRSDKQRESVVVEKLFRNVGSKRQTDSALGRPATGNHPKNQINNKTDYIGLFSTVDLPRACQT